MKIDAHHHFWRYSSEEYGWIDESMARIRGDFLPDDLRKTIASAGIDAVVSVQARQTVEETDWLLQLASWNPFIAGVIGWLPLRSPGIDALLERTQNDPKLKGLRHVVQGEADGFMLEDDFNRGLSLLASRGLAYDLLILERQLPEAIRLVDRHPGQRFILDHVAKPLVRQGTLQPWLARMKELALRENVWCKLSGLVTEADYASWTEEGLHPFMEGALEAFGSKRLLFGSDWPVCLVACEYARWHEVVESLVAHLSADERARFWYRNAIEAYQLKLPLNP